MSRTTAGASAHTPQKVRIEYDQIVNSLNMKWNLGLPLLHSNPKAAKQDGTSEIDSIARQCSGQIRFMCFRECGLDRAVQDFETNADQIVNSNWVFKPQQEKGTLPKKTAHVVQIPESVRQLPVTKNFMSTRSVVSQQHRETLVRQLFEDLKDDFALAQSSGSFKRTSAAKSNIIPPVAPLIPLQQEPTAQPNRMAPTPPVKRTQWSLNVQRADNSSAALGTTPKLSAKRKSSERPESHKSPKKQITLFEMDNLHLRSHSTTTTATDAAIHISTRTLNQSLDSVVSADPAPIFTNQASPSSASSEGCISPESNYGFSTQDLNDEDIQKSFTECCEPTRADSLHTDLLARSPFKEVDETYSDSLSHIQNFAHRFELVRVAKALGSSPIELLSALRRQKISSIDGVDKFWAACRKIAREKGRELPNCSSHSAWSSAEKFCFTDDKQHRSVYFAGSLSFKKKGDPSGLLDFHLKPMEVENSCRLHRKYGPSRFMQVSLPSRNADAPEHLKADLRSGQWSQAVAKFMTGEHSMLGRKWTAFYIEIPKPKKGKSATTPIFKFHLFAMTGSDIPREQNIQIHELLNWHIPVHKNLASTNLKLFQRWKLGLTKTTSTIALQRSEFIRLRDPKEHAVMSDGCARMSRSLAAAIALEMGLSHGHVPTAFQGRIGGAKGLWMVVPDVEMGASGTRNFVIEVSDSQLKIKPHPRDDEGADIQKRTFEVVEYSKPGRVGYLNIQLITVLHACEVPDVALASLLIKDMASFHEEIDNAMGSPENLRLWVQSSTATSSGRDDRWCGSFLEGSEDQAVMLIESGFSLDDNEILRDCIQTQITRHLDSYIDKLRIKVPCSTSLYCIADPYGVLEPGEIHVSLSDVWKDPESGFQESFLDGQDVLVARSPALLASDVQRVQAVFKKKLRHFKDVAVFSTKGETPLADMLSGGDYDGDTVWICWDMSLVGPFRNAARPQQPTKRDCGLTSRNQNVKDVFCDKNPHTRLASGVTRFLRDCITFNLAPDLLGQCTSEHEKLVYSTNDLSSPEAIMLATLSGFLVDADKQGDSLDLASWTSTRGKISPWPLKEPAYKNDTFVSVPRAAKGTNIMDFLKFKKAVPEQTKILKHFHQKWGARRAAKDIVLCSRWNSVKPIRSKRSSDPLSRCLSQLEDEISQLHKQWQLQLPPGGKWAEGQFKAVIASLYAKYQDIRPSNETHQYSEMWRMQIEKGNQLGDWPLLVASCLHAAHGLSKYTWYLAGKELCYLKAENANEGYRIVINPIHSVYKCDAKLVKRRQGCTGEGEAEDSGDEFHDCMDVIPAG